MDDERRTDVLESEEIEHTEGEDERWEEPGEEEWEELAEEGELPPRPRNRLLRPLPIALIAVLIAASGFLAGVLIQKGSEDGGGGGLSGGGELPSFLSELGSSGSGGEGAVGLPAGIGGDSDAAVTGTVTGVDGSTIYVEDADGNTVAVRAQDGSTVTRDAEVGMKKIRPGDSVVVEGSTRGSTVKASSISATEDGVETAPAGLGGLMGEGGGDGDGDGGGSVESLFGE